MGLIGLIKSDLHRFSQTYELRGQVFSKRRIFWESILFKGGFQAVLFYRISHWFFKIKLMYLAWFFSRLNLLFTHAEIEFNADIGPGMFIAHPAGIVIGRGTVIGSDVTIFQGVSFGVKSWHLDEIKKFPKVGNNCFFFANSVILGDISIGNNCIIAAHSVVNCDLPDGSMAMGIPAKIYPDRGENAIKSWRLDIQNNS